MGKSEVRGAKPPNGSAKPFGHYAPDLGRVQAVKAEPVKGTPRACKVVAGHVMHDLDQRVDNRRRRPRGTAQCAHRDETDRHVFGDVFVIK
jgi:hypothetical protein